MPLAFAKQLITIAAELSVKENDALILIITRLLNDLNLGHSCTILTDKTADLTIEEQIGLLLKSKLAVKYNNFPKQLAPLPISIINKKNKPLIYITKYLQYELDLLSKVNLLCSSLYEEKANYQGKISLEQVSVKFALPNKEQLSAIINCLKYKMSIITGGPGTGKTTTVALLIWLLYQSYGSDIKIKICAPTGKASNRIRDSIQSCINNPNLSFLDFTNVANLLLAKDNFLTIHKLLGYQANNIYFRHNKNNQLDLDVLIIDESSMVSLPLFSKLFVAVNEQRIKHVILLGDKNQLSSVEEGYVFATMVNAAKIKPHVTSLVKSNRNNLEISNLAQAVNTENITDFNQLLHNSTNIKMYRAKLSALFEKQIFAKNTNSFHEYFNYIAKADVSDTKKLFYEFNRRIILCLTNVGMFGTQYINMQIEKKIILFITALNEENQTQSFDLFSKPQLFKLIDNQWYTGRPIIILENDYSLELFNGDVGICIVTDDKAQIVFENGRKFIPEALPKYQVAYAITIHKSQGSEYEHVNLVLCDNSGVQGMSSLLSKELIYTGITRAKTSIGIFAGDQVLTYAIGNKTHRNTGLDSMLE